MSASKLYIFSSPPKVELDARSYFGPCNWGGYVWDRKKWEPPPHRYTFLEVEAMCESSEYSKHLSTMPSSRYMQIVDMMKLLNGELGDDL